MRKSRFSEDQVIAILGEQERGMATADICRKHGISEETFHKWTEMFGGIDVAGVRKPKAPENEITKLKALASENDRLKKLLAEAILDNAVLKDLLDRS